MCNEAELLPKPMWLKHASAILNDYIRKTENNRDISFRALMEAYMRGNKAMGKRDRQESAQIVYFILRHFLSLKNHAEALPAEIKNKFSLGERLVYCRLFLLTQLHPAHAEWLYPLPLTPAILQQARYTLTQAEAQPHSPRWLSLAYSFDEGLVRTLLQRWSAPLVQHILHGLQYIQASEIDFMIQSALHPLSHKYNPPQHAPVYIRVNTAKTSKKKLQARLQAQGIESENICGLPALRLRPKTKIKGGAYITQKISLQTLHEFAQGFFEVQDIGSLALAETCVRRLPAKEKNQYYVVIDACAGAGGKSLYLSNLLRRQDKIIAFDTNIARLNKIYARLKRAEANNVSVYRKGLSHFLQDYHEAADVVFLDAPCSGSGTVSRNPENAWRYNLQDVMRLQKKQKEILRVYSSLLKRGGRLVYATCSIWSLENEDVAEWFNAEYSALFTPLPIKELFPFVKFKINRLETVPILYNDDSHAQSQDEVYLKIFPHLHAGDAFFAAAWVKN